MSREKLLETRNALMSLVDRERQENKKYGIKHFSHNTRKILDRIWNLDHQIMLLTF